MILKSPCTVQFDLRTTLLKNSSQPLTITKRQSTPCETPRLWDLLTSHLEIPTYQIKRYHVIYVPCTTVLFIFMNLLDIYQKEQQKIVKNFCTNCTRLSIKKNIGKNAWDSSSFSGIFVPGELNLRMTWQSDGNRNLPRSKNLATLSTHRVRWQYR